MDAKDGETPGNGSSKRLKKAKVPKTTVGRLPYYLRVLYILQQSNIPLVSSEEVAKLIGSNSAQVRKDLSYIGEFGQRGVGYDVPNLIHELEHFLGITHLRHIVLVGVGRLGTALLNYPGFHERGFQLIAAFDNDPKKVGTKVAGVTVYHIDEMSDVLKRETIDIGVVTVPSDAAQFVVDELIRAGVRSILNFAPMPVSVPDGIPKRAMCIAAEMQILSYHLKGQRGRRKRPPALRR